VIIICLVELTYRIENVDNAEIENIFASIDKINFVYKKEV